MSNAITAQFPARVSAYAVSRSQAIPWYIWCCVAASSSILTGLYWDVSWHATIGRDTFWTPAHLLIQFAGILTAISSGVLIFSTTFGSDQAAKRASVSVLGFRGPMGAFIAAWGGVAMLASAPFDNWWHDAYGLDVKIISPPHMVLALGIASILWGAVILILGQMNRAEETLQRRLHSLLLACSGMIVVLYFIITLQSSGRVFMHSPIAYVAASLGLPFLLESMARASGWRWARTAMASIYMAFFLLAVWIFPLFPGEPKLGPVYFKVTHMVPLGFPMLLAIPAFVLDYLWPKVKSWNKSSQALIAGTAFLAVMVAVQWPFASLLSSPAGHNWFFGTIYHYYATPPNSLDVRNEFYHSLPAAFWIGMASAWGLAVLSTLGGIVFGNWMREVRR
ncbi:MAG TPA: hypothetical protein VNW97_05700 [Candidatus Saccharimonadales bacterium]|jgi:hypothetical protein|nr:hypothetical protein [Candidatus Saccharimonadales bacterium]